MKSTTEQPADDVLERLRRSEELYARAFIQNPVAMAITDGESQCFTAVNQRFLELVGHWRAEVIGRTSDELGLWPNRAERTIVADRLSQDGAMPFTRAPVRAKDGSLVTCLVGFSLVEVDGKGFVISSLIPVDDVPAAGA